MLDSQKKGRPYISFPSFAYIDPHHTIECHTRTPEGAESEDYISEMDSVFG